VIAELRKSYRGVSCLTCSEPIAVSSSLVGLQDDIDSGNANSRRTFLSRCSMCDRQNRYSIADVRTFEGESHKVRSRHRKGKRYDSSTEAMMKAEQLAGPNESFNVERYDSSCGICSPRQN
jgi:hypothetical protein